jgi:glycine dehydrogenase subunit 1
MPYIPNTDDDRRIMLQKIGVNNIDDLIRPVPENLRLKGSLHLPEPLSELELSRQMLAISEKNKSDLVMFAGGGIYDHFIPAAIGAIAGRPEFVTAYTPYQAEVAQGTLQVIYEFQSHICRMTGMDAANASMYDGATAAAEAVHLAVSNTKKKRVIISDTVSPLFRDVIATYLSGQHIEIIVVPNSDGKSDFNRIKDLIDDNTAALLLAQPNFFGLIDDIEMGAELIHKVGGLLIMAIDPISAFILKTPADCGADIVVGEGQPLGIPPNFGGPLLGFLAVKKELVRLIPGRIAARTADDKGRVGFVLTLQTREQHIRREKATSNICTNQALCATIATIYMSLMGKNGLKKIALLCMDKTHRTAEKIFSIPGYKPYFNGAFIRELVIKTPVPASQLIDRLIEKNNILAGIDLGRFYGNMKDALLLTVTEKRSEEEIDSLVQALKQVN